MKYKLAMCKITMIGSPALVLGVCRYDEDDEFWLMYQYFTMEDYLNCQYVYTPSEFSMYKDQEHADKESAHMRKMAESHSRFHGETVHFESINKDIKVLKSKHSFNMKDAEPLELTKDELALVTKELNKDGWQEFDLETWGK